MTHRGHQFCYRTAFYPYFYMSPCSSAYIITLRCRALLGRLYLFTSYALHCLLAFRNLEDQHGVVCSRFSPFLLDFRPAGLLTGHSCESRCCGTYKYVYHIRSYTPYQYIKILRYFLFLHIPCLRQTVFLILTSLQEQIVLILSISYFHILEQTPVSSCHIQRYLFCKITKNFLQVFDAPQYCSLFAIRIKYPRRLPVALSLHL